MRASEIISELKKNRVVPKLVDDQLKLVGETRNLSNDLLKLIKDRKNELRSFLMEAMDGVSSTPIPSIQKQGRYLATHAQKRIWILSQFKGGGPAYNIVAGFYLKGPIFLIILNAAFNAVIERHESLRTLFKDEDSELRQIILDQLRIKVDFENIENTTDVKSYLKAEEEKFRNFHFDLQRGPLISIRLFRISELEHALLLGVHHIVCDGWSATIIFREVMHWYNEYRRGITPVARSLKIQYKDFASWQDHRIADSKGQKAKDFWNRQFSTLINPLNLPVDYPGAAIKNFEGGLFRSYFEDQFYTRISSFCKENHTTLFNFFRATLAILLNKFSGQDDLVIGTPVSGRNHFDLEDQVGMYVNTLPLRITIDVRDSFLAFLTKISDHSFEAFQYQDYPFDKIIEDLPISWNAGGNPLFDVMMVVQDIMHGETIARINQESEFELCELDSYLYQSSCIQRENVPSKFDLSFNFAFDAGNKYYLEIEYAAKLFKKESISRILNAYRLIVVQVLDSPGTILNAIEIIDTAQKHNILTLFNATEADYVREKTIVHLFEEQAARTPDHIAVACEGRELSYADLN
ncbi:MAG TPA: condensation domain-containing protein, partial [Puia sp.]